MRIVIVQRNDKVVHFFNVIYDGDKNGNVENYYILNDRSTRFGKLVFYEIKLSNPCIRDASTTNFLLEHYTELSIIYSEL